MTDSDIRVFLAVLKYGSMTEAAKFLFITQPALSRKLKTLEEELGFKLFIRGKGRHDLTLSEYGRGFVPIAEKWVNVYDETEKYKVNGKNRTLRIGAVDSMNTYLLPSVYKRQLYTYPNIELELTLVHDRSAYEEIIENNCDIVFVDEVYYSARVHVQELFKERMVVVSRTKMDKKSVKPKDLDVSREVELTWMTEFFKWHDILFGIGARPLVCVDKMSLLEYFLNEKDTWSLMPESIARHFMESGEYYWYELDAQPLHRTCYMLTDRMKKSQSIDNFIVILKNELKKNGYDIK